jgi:hypothetical protein
MISEHKLIFHVKFVHKLGNQRPPQNTGNKQDGFLKIVVQTRRLFENSGANKTAF